jgi:hypothetical protein
MACALSCWSSSWTIRERTRGYPASWLARWRRTTARSARLRPAGTRSHRRYRTGSHRAVTYPSYGAPPSKHPSGETDLATYSPGAAGMGRNRPFLNRRTTCLTLEGRQSLLEALEDVVLASDALRQFVDPLLLLLVLDFQGPQPVSHLRVRRDRRLPGTWTGLR